MTLVLQESGGQRWTAAVQSPIPVRTSRRLSRWQRALLFTSVVLFVLAQLLTAFAPRKSAPPQESLPSAPDSEGQP